MTHAARTIDVTRMADLQAAARAAGLTRLADITGLDRLGVPVFQAIRPMSRALSVHQGKGFTAPLAQVSALMEAVESDRAERLEPVGPLRAYGDLPAEHRPRDLGDFARGRADPPCPLSPRHWTEAERLLDARPILVPFDCVSLDFTRPWDLRLDHASHGLGARFDFEGAMLKGLTEVVERDASATWARQPMAFRATSRIGVGAIDAPWLAELSQRLASAGVRLALYHLPALAGLTTVRAELMAHGDGCPAVGTACAAEPEAALQGAVLEAVQSRLTLIAGARDDILHREPGPDLWGGACPLPPDHRPLDWPAIAERRGPAAAQDVAEALAAAGYPDACVVRLSDRGAGVVVVKVLVPGLGACERARRRPA